MGTKVYAAEIDPKLFANLQSELTDFISKDQLNLINKDAVKYPLGNLPITEKDFAVIANLPYAISSPWLESVLNANRIPKRMVLMLQKEAVERMNATYGTKHYNALSIFLSASFRQTKVHPVPRQCFHPAPGIDSVLVRIDKKETHFSLTKKTECLFEEYLLNAESKLVH